MGMKQKMNEFDYALLTNTWEGPKAAAYSATWDFCREFGWVTAEGEITKLGKLAITEYEKS